MKYERSRRRIASVRFDARPARDAAWAAGASYRLLLLHGHPLAVSVAATAERRAPMMLRDRGHLRLAQSHEVDLTWSPVPGLLIGAGWKSQGSPARRRQLNRAIDIAAGNPISEAGPHMQIDVVGRRRSVLPSSWRIGVDAGAYRIASRDLEVLGTRRTQDERLSLTVRVGL